LPGPNCLDFLGLKVFSIDGVDAHAALALLALPNFFSHVIADAECPNDLESAVRAQYDAEYFGGNVLKDDHSAAHLRD